MEIKSSNGASYLFEGPFMLENIKNISGIYAIVDYRLNGMYYLLDVGESGELQDRIKNHDRKDQWLQKKQGYIEFYIYYTPYTPKKDRLQIEHGIRAYYGNENLCGER